MDMTTKQIEELTLAPGIRADRIGLSNVTKNDVPAPTGRHIKDAEAHAACFDETRYTNWLHNVRNIQVSRSRARPQQIKQLIAERIETIEKREANEYAKLTTELHAVEHTRDTAMRANITLLTHLRTRTTKARGFIITRNPNDTGHE